MFFPTKVLIAVALISLHSNALILNCNYGNVSWTLLGSIYTCTGNIQASGDLIHVRNVTGNHTAGNNDSSVRAVALANQFLEGIPSNIDQFFPDLTVLSLSNVGLRHISRNDFIRYRNLQILILFNNNLESLDGDLFTHTPSLQYVNLSSNRLRHFGSNIFDRLSGLRTLRLTHNVCIDRYVDNNATEMASFRWQVSFQCPPSTAQIENEIINGPVFSGIIAGLSSQIYYLENRVQSLENQINSSSNEQ